MTVHGVVTGHEVYISVTELCLVLTDNPNYKDLVQQLIKYKQEMLEDENEGN